jgi:hypothetical protein
MQRGSQKNIAVIALLTVNLVVSTFIVLYLFVPVHDRSVGNGILDFKNTENGQYVLYIGTNDKDTYEQIIPTDEAKEIVNEICAKYVEGYTVSDMKGVWVDEKGVPTQEDTLVYIISYADEPDIVAIMNEALTALGQNSILVERRDISSVFYHGKV